MQANTKADNDRSVMGLDKVVYHAEHSRAAMKATEPIRSGRLPRLSISAQGMKDATKNQVKRKPDMSPAIWLSKPSEVEKRKPA